jgi:F-type H+-transporting ATPase subunit delta
VATRVPSPSLFAFRPLPGGPPHPSSEAASGDIRVASTATETSGLAARYATALFDLADERRALDAVAAELQQIKRLLAESEDLRRLVRSPVLSREEQERAMAAVLTEAGVSDLVRRFVGLVASNRRLFALEAMIDAFLAELARRRGEMVAEVTAAAPLSEAQERALVDQLKQALGAKVTIDVKTDPSLLGGMVVRVGSRMIDYSLKSKLARLQTAMKGVG